MKYLQIFVVSLLCFLNSGMAQNNALDFDGVDDFVEIPSPLTISSDLTFEAWFSSTATVFGGFNRLVSFGGSGTRFEIGESNGNVAYFIYPNSGNLTEHTIISDSNIRDGDCHHIAVVKDSTNFYIYLDGVELLFLADVFIDDFLINSFMRLGKWSGDVSGQFWKGKMDEVKLWGRALTHDEILTRKDQELLGTEPAIVLYYNFNQGIAGGMNSIDTILKNLSYTSDIYNGQLVNFELNGDVSNWVESCAEIKQYCAIECCKGENDGMQDLTLGALSAIPPSQAPSWTEPSGTGLVVEDGCQNINSIQLPKANTGNGPNYLTYSKGEGINGPISLFSIDNYYCITLCAKITTGSGQLLVFLDEELFWIFDSINSNDDWINISIPPVLITQDYYTIQFFFFDNGDPDKKMRIDNVCLEKTDVPGFCNAEFNYEISDCGEICFTDVSCGADYTRSWTFSGVSFSDEIDPCFNIEESGDYNVCLSIEGENCIDEYCKIIFIEYLDDEAPIWNVDEFEIYLDEEGVASLSTEYFEGSITDNCTIDTIIFNTTEINCDDIGDLEEEITVIDGSGNQATKLVIIEVIDTIRPIISNMSQVVYLDENGVTFLTTEYFEESITDNCTIDTIIFNTTEINCDDIGDLEEEITVIDDSGNQMTEKVFIQVLDTIRPVCSIDNIKLQINENGEVELNTNIFNDQVTDNCGEVFIEPEVIVFNCENVGLNSIDLSIMDQSGNLTYCIIEVEVTDPFYTDCMLEDVMVEATEEDGAYVIFDLEIPSLCGFGSVNYTPASNSFFECGEHDILATFTGFGEENMECTFKLLVDGCEGCCRSESLFLNSINTGFTAEIKENNGEKCVVQLYPPDLEECQFVTQIIWDDGTISNGKFPGDIDFIHEYTSKGDFNICITIKEYIDEESCYEKQICQTYSLLDGCNLTSSIYIDKSEMTEIFPIPSTNNIFIKSETVFEKYKVFNLSGETIDQGELTQPYINISNYANGLYYLKLIKGNNNIVKQIIKTN